MSSVRRHRCHRFRRWCIIDGLGAGGPGLGSSLAWWACGIVMLLFAASAAAEPAQGFWPKGMRGAVSLSFDDGMPSQLDRAVPLLDELALKATFYVNPVYSLGWLKNKERWRQLAISGHEIGNHTDKHPCSCHHSYRSDGDYCLERLQMEEIVRSIEDAEKAIRSLLPAPQANAPRSFAYPCYQSHVGAGALRRSYVPEVARRYAAARAGSDKANEPLTVDMAYLYSFPADFQSAETVIRHIDEAVAKGHWAIIVFHGIGADWNRIEVREFEKIVRHLAANRDRIWIDTVIKIAEYLPDHR